MTGEQKMAQDLDPAETEEWLDSLDAVLEFDGPDRATFLLDELIGQARRSGAAAPYSANTPYLRPDRSRRSQLRQASLPLGHQRPVLVAGDLELTIHPHPTLSETVDLAAEAFEGTITDLYLPKKK
jgi:hypothetical protein